MELAKVYMALGDFAKMFPEFKEDGFRHLIDQCT
jgi:hypothetical protein